MYPSRCWLVLTDQIKGENKARASQALINSVLTINTVMCNGQCFTPRLYRYYETKGVKGGGVKGKKAVKDGKEKLSHGYPQILTVPSGRIFVLSPWNWAR